MLPGRAHCRWHSPDPFVVADRLAASSRGGAAGAGAPTNEPLADAENLTECNLETAEGLRSFLAKALQHLARLPFTTTTAYAMAQLVTAQRGVVDVADIEERLRELEALGEPWRRAS